MVRLKRLVTQSGLAGFMLLACLCCLSPVVASCHAIEAADDSRSVEESHSVWKEWDIVEATPRSAVQSDTWIEGLSRYDILYLGEEHHNPSHIEAALTILRSLIDRGQTPVLALEMFAWDGQPALDRYVKNDGMTRQEFLEQSRWEQNWGGPFDDYEPLVEFARSHHLAVVAMNPPKRLIRNVVRHGLTALRSDSEWSRWDMAAETIVDDPPYRDRIMEQLRQCHGGGAPEEYQTMYEASMVRDEAMAKTVASLWSDMRSGARPLGPIVSYTGGGHIQYGLPVPKRVARRLSHQARQVTIYMTSFEPSRSTEIRQLLDERVADYLWLTPVGKQGLPRRCR